MFDAVIFDFDGVIVDVSQSYRQAIRLAANAYLKQTGISPMVTDSDVSLVKSLPGFNNDWTASFALVELKEKNLKTPERVSLRQLKSQKYATVKELFQAFYLGEKLFKQTYNQNPPLKFEGLIENEKLLLKPEVLTQLAQRFKLGIATGRPRAEINYAVKRNSLEKFFPLNKIIALEDYEKEKPAAEPLLKAVKAVQAKEPVYVGDSINDVLAAKSAGMKSIFVGSKKLGDFQIKETNDLLKVLS